MCHFLNWIFLGQITISFSKKITILLLFLDYISDGYVTDDFTTAGVVSGIGATHDLVDVHVNCVQPLNNASICA